MMHPSRDPVQAYALLDAWLHEARGKSGPVPKRALCLSRRRIADTWPSMIHLPGAMMSSAWLMYWYAWIYWALGLLRDFATTRLPPVYKLGADRCLFKHPRLTGEVDLLTLPQTCQRMPSSRYARVVPIKDAIEHQEPAPSDFCTKPNTRLFTGMQPSILI